MNKHIVKHIPERHHERGEERSLARKLGRNPVRDLVCRYSYCYITGSTVTTVTTGTEIHRANYK